MDSRSGTLGLINPANAMTAARFFTVPPFIYCVAQGDYQYASVLLVICALLDVLDGKVAKLLDCTSQFGEVFDAVADAICYGSFLLTLGVYEWLPRWPVGIILTGVVNTVIRAVYAKRAGKAINYRSLAMERVVGYGAFLVGAGLCRFEAEVSAWGLAAVILIVIGYDAKRMLLDPVAQ